VEVHLVCATRGEAGEMDADCLEGFASIAERREHELRCAAEILGLAGVHFLDYRDSGMSGSPDNRHPQALAAAPCEEVAARIVRYIRELRPQVVITFVHRRVQHPITSPSTATVEAFRATPTVTPAGRASISPPTPKAYYHVFPRP
jgi:LmbE family N-acetylglucosaminyl deacetylase